MKTWKDAVVEEMGRCGESWDMVVAVADNYPLSEAPVSQSWGGGTNTAFTVWTENRVYIPVQYDGMEWCSSVPRNPCDEKTDPVGG